MAYSEWATYGGILNYNNDHPAVELLAKDSDKNFCELVINIINMSYRKYKY